MFWQELSLHDWFDHICLKLSSTSHFYSEVVSAFCTVRAEHPTNTPWSGLSLPDSASRGLLRDCDRDPDIATRLTLRWRNCGLGWPRHRRRRNDPTLDPPILRRSPCAYILAFLVDLRVAFRIAFVSSSSGCDLSWRPFGIAKSWVEWCFRTRCRIRNYQARIVDGIL